MNAFPPHFLAPHIHIVHHDAVAIMANGKPCMLRDLGNQRPALILNADELNVESAKAVIAQGAYRKIFADPKRFGAALDYKRRTIANYSPDKLFSETTGIYDDLADTLDGRLEPLLGRMLGERYDKAINILLECLDDVIADANAMHMVRSQENPLSNYVIPAANNPQSAEALLQNHFEHLTQKAQHSLDVCGCNIWLADDMRHIEKPEEHLGESIYTTGRIHLLANGDPIVSLEEMIHQIDLANMSSQSHAWIDATTKDLPHSEQLQLAYRDALSKGIRKQAIQKYSPTQQPLELLAEIAILDLFGIEPDGKPLKEHVPHCWPIYEQFRDRYLSDEPGKTINGEHLLMDGEVKAPSEENEIKK